MRKTIQRLLDSKKPAYAISKATKVDASTIQRIRKGERKLGNLTLEMAEKINLYQIKREKR